MPDEFDRSKESIDVIRIKDLILERERAVALAHANDAMLDSLMTVALGVTSTGFAFVCTRCRFEGFSIDFLALAANHCPNCEYEGYIQLKQLLPVGSQGDMTARFSAVSMHFRTLQTWFNSLENKPQMANEAIINLSSELRGLGILQ